MFAYFKKRKREKLETRKEEEKLNKEYKQRVLQERCDWLNTEYAAYLNVMTFCKALQEMFLFREFIVRDDEIRIKFNTYKTPEGFITDSNYEMMQFTFGDDFLKKFRIEFLNLKKQLTHFGLEIKKIKNANEERDTRETE